MADLFQLIKDDHQEVKKMLDQLKRESEKGAGDSEQIFLQLKSELVPHMKAEEASLYSAMEKKPQANFDALHGFEAHHVAETVFKELDESGSKQDKHWAAKLVVFKDLVEHHIQEEESNVFKTVKNAFSQSELQNITQSFQTEKEKIKSRMG